MSIKRKIRNSFDRDKSVSLLSSMGGGRHSINPSRDISKKSLGQSLKGTKGSRTITTYRTVMTWRSCGKGIRILVTLIIFVAYIIVFAFYLSRDSEQVKEIWIPSPFKLSYLQCYYLMRIIVQSFMILFCLVFWIEFILYTAKEWIKEVHRLTQKKKMTDSFAQYQEYSLNKLNLDNDNDNKLPKRHHRYRNKHKKGGKFCNICRKLCSINFCCKRCGFGIAKVMLLEYSELHILCMFSAIYYFLSAMLRLRVGSSRTNVGKSLFYLYIINDLVTTYGMIMPPIAYSLMLQLKMIYQRRGSVSDITVAGSQWEKKSKAMIITTATMYVSIFVHILCTSVHTI